MKSILRQLTSRVATVAVATLVLSATNLAAQPSMASPAGATKETGSTEGRRMSGLSIGLYSLAAPGLSITGDDIDGGFKTKLGGGVGAMVGFGITSHLATFASLDLAKQESGARVYGGSFGLAHFEVGARLNLAEAGASTVPYASVSVGRRAVGARVQYIPDEEDIDLRLSGRMYSVGWGVERFLSAHTTLDLGGEFAFGKFDRYDSEGEHAPLDVNASKSLRFRVGFTWRP